MNHNRTQVNGKALPKWPNCEYIVLILSKKFFEVPIIFFRGKQTRHWDAA